MLPPDIIAQRNMVEAFMGRATILTEPFIFIEPVRKYGFKDLHGKKFSRLAVAGYVGSRKGSRWGCVCDCGNRIIVSAHHLVSGCTTSCGCFQKENMSLVKKIHGAWDSPEYRRYASMLSRCSRTRKDRKNARYIERGIKVCDRWQSGEDGLSGFECYMNDMGPRPSPKHSIDRIDNDGNYEPSNCRWATRSQQDLNKSNSAIIDVNGEKMTVTEAAERFGINRVVLFARIRNGWDVIDAVTRPVAKRKKV